MAISFTPQFHKRIAPHSDGNVWVATPHPETLIPLKTAYYRAWQEEECQRLRNEGEEVMAFAVSH